MLHSKLNLFFREEVKAGLYIKDYAENPSKMPSASSGIITWASPVLRYLGHYGWENKDTISCNISQAETKVGETAE